MKQRAPLQLAALQLAVFLFAMVPVFAKAAPASGSNAYLGISVVGVPDYLRDHVDLPEGIGLLITRVMAEGPGDRAGLKAHDILLCFGDQLVVNREQLMALLALKGPGAEVPVKVLRRSGELECLVRLGERSAANQPSTQDESATKGQWPPVPEVDELGEFLELLEKWIPETIRLMVGDEEAVKVDLDQLKADLKSLGERIRRLHGSEAPGDDAN